MGSEDDAGYLVCEDCNGFYKLKKGESPADFEECECGGQLKHTITLNNEPNKKESSPKNFCPNCGNENVNNPKFCENCGQPMGTEKQESTPKGKGAGRITRAIVYSIFVLIVFLIFVYFFIPIMYSFFALLLFLIFIIGGVYGLRYGLRRI